ncbi:MAG: hypothetical protein ACLQLG_07860 [Thermoguttaceae bacterium]
MHIEVVDFREALTGAVADFNRRLLEGGQPVSFPASAVPEWLPKLSGRKLFQELYVAADAEGSVHGGYLLKYQEFRIGDQTLSIGDFQLPVSEGFVNRAYMPLGAALLRNAERRMPLLYSLGMGPLSEPLPRLLAASGWRVTPVPFFFRIVHPVPFLRNGVYLRRNVLLRRVLDVLAFSGLGWAGVKLVYAVAAPAPAPAPTTSGEIVEEFSEWTDRVWETCRAHYGMCAVRDMETLQILYPRDDARFVRLRIRRGAETIGWAVLLNNRWWNHKHFGRMRLGSIADVLAAPADAAEVVRCATRFLQQRGVDLIVSNQSHAAWRRAFRKSGYLRGPSNFNFASSKPLSGLLQSAGVQQEDMHWTRGDGDGPINL